MMEIIMPTEVLRPKYKMFANIWLIAALSYFIFCVLTDAKYLGTTLIEIEWLELFGFDEYPPLEGPFYLIQWFMANLTMLFVSTIPSDFLRRLSLFDSYKAMTEFDNKKREEAYKPIFLGKVISSRVEYGGCFSSPTSTIETESGYYRVAGDIGSIEKGTAICKVKAKNALYIGLPSNNRKFLLI